MSLYTKDAHVAVPPFTRQPDGDEVIIGRVDTGVFLAIPPEAIEVLDNLAAGKTVGEAAEIYQQNHGEAPDLEDFLTLLQRNGMVRLLNGPVASTEASAASVKRYHFENFPQTLARRIFSLPALCVCSIFVSVAIGLVMIDSSLIPRSRDLYFWEYRALTWAILILINYGGLFVHEISHLVAARALGINSRMAISNRLWYLVAETDLTGLWAVPKRQRYLALLAGTVVDAVCWSVLVFLLFAYDRNRLALRPPLVGLLHATTFTYVMRIVWQCFLFLRTDFYYVIANFFNCRNLLGDTEVFLRNQLARIVPRIPAVNQSHIPESEQRVIRIYAVVWLLGRVFAIALLFVITIPLGISYVHAVSDSIQSGYSANPGKFLDAVLLSCYFFVPLTIGFALWIRGMVRPERTAR